MAANVSRANIAAIAARSSDELTRRFRLCCGLRLCFWWALLLLMGLFRAYPCNAAAPATDIPTIQVPPVEEQAPFQREQGDCLYYEYLTCNSGHSTNTDSSDSSAGLIAILFDKFWAVFGPYLSGYASKTYIFSSLISSSDVELPITGCPCPSSVQYPGCFIPAGSLAQTKQIYYCSQIDFNRGYCDVASINGFGGASEPHCAYKMLCDGGFKPSYVNHTCFRWQCPTDAPRLHCPSGDDFGPDCVCRSNCPSGYHDVEVTGGFMCVKDGDGGDDGGGGKKECPPIDAWYTTDGSIFLEMLRDRANQFSYTHFVSFIRGLSGFPTDLACPIYPIHIDFIDYDFVFDFFCWPQVTLVIQGVGFLVLAMVTFWSMGLIFGD